jgi:hypothetical protein
MAKRILISKDKLPELNSLTESYAVRFRLITEDRNKLSYWSPIFSVDPGFVYIPGEIDIAKNGQQINVVWDSVSIEKEGNFVGQVQQYDIWLRWSKNDENGDWVYKERVQTTSTSFIIPSTFFFEGVDQEEAPNRITIEIFLKASPITRTNNNLLVYSPPIQTI